MSTGVVQQLLIAVLGGVASFVLSFLVWDRRLSRLEAKCGEGAYSISARLDRINERLERHIAEMP